VIRFAHPPDDAGGDHDEDATSAHGFPRPSNSNASTPLRLFGFCCHDVLHGRALVTVGGGSVPIGGGPVFGNVAIPRAGRFVVEICCVSVQLSSSVMAFGGREVRPFRPHPRLVDPLLGGVGVGDRLTRRQVR
jgi:hypothetical protein